MPRKSIPKRIEKARKHMSARRMNAIKDREKRGFDEYMREGKE